MCQQWCSNCEPLALNGKAGALAGPTDGNVEFEKMGHPGESALSQAMLEAQQQDEKDQNEE